MLRSLVVFLALLGAAPAFAATPEQVLGDWYGLIFNLVRHTAIYSPPVASRAFAYMGIAAYEANASGNDKQRTLVGQLNGLKNLPKREAGKTYDEAVVLNAAVAAAAQHYFAGTGPSGQHALQAQSAKAKAEVAKGVAADVVARSEAYGKALEAAIYQWSLSDGGAHVTNLGFPVNYTVSKEPGHWVPTNTYRLQQHPLLPDWGKNRSFAMPQGTTCPVEPPLAYSEDKASAFYKQAQEVHDVRNGIGEEQRTIARFWSDDPGLSTTPPGHWMQLVMLFAARDHLPAAKTTEALARVGIAVADAFIGCWQAKYKYDYIRPVTYIKAHIDAKWDTVLITPPFPEYTSGHSVASGAAELAMAKEFGDHTAFDDSTHARDNLGVRHFESFHAAAEEAGISRMYGGIHFRQAIEEGLKQGRCIGAHAAKLEMGK